jgi:hypothetical protein
MSYDILVESLKTAFICKLYANKKTLSSFYTVSV